MNKTASLFKLIVLIIFFGCNHKTSSSLAFIDIENMQNGSIIDMSSSLNFDNKDELIILDSLFLSETIALVKDSSKKYGLIYLVNQEDRLQLRNLQYRVNKVQEYFINKGVDKSILKAELGLDYQTKYPTLKNSNVILQIH